jgi:hypothetical protein
MNRSGHVNPSNGNVAAPSDEPAGGADHPSAGVSADAIGGADVNAHRILVLAEIDQFVTEHHLDVRKFPYSVEQNAGSLELLALHEEGILRVLRKNGVVEFGDEPVREAVPKPEDRRTRPTRAISSTNPCSASRSASRLRAGRSLWSDSCTAAPRRPSINYTQQSDRAATRDQQATISTRHW